MTSAVCAAPSSVLSLAASLWVALASAMAAASRSPRATAERYCMKAMALAATAMTASTAAGIFQAVLVWDSSAIAGPSQGSPGRPERRRDRLRAVRAPLPPSALGARWRAACTDDPCETAGLPACGLLRRRLVPILAQVPDDAGGTGGLACSADVTPVQDQPMV